MKLMCDLEERTEQEREKAGKWKKENQAKTTQKIKQKLANRSSPREFRETSG